MSSRSMDGAKPDSGLGEDFDPRLPASRLTGSLVPAASAQAHLIGLEIQNRELREAQRALERARTRYFELFDSAPISYLIFDDRHHLEELNAAAAELLGGDCSQWRHRPFFPHLVDADRQRFHQHLQSVLRQHRRAEVELEFIRPDGKIQRIRLMSHFVLPEPGERPVCLSAVLPVMANRTSEFGSGSGCEALWGKHLHHASIPAAVAALQGGWVFLNPAFRTSLGYTEQELLGIGWIALTHPEDRDREVPPYNRILAGESDSYRIDKRLSQKGGTWIWVRATVSCTRTREGRPELLFYTLQSIAPPAASQNLSGPLTAGGLESETASASVELHELLSEARAEFADPSAPCRLRWALASQVPKLMVQRRAMLDVLRHLIQNAREAIGTGSGRITISTGRQFVEPDLWDRTEGGQSGCSGDCVFLEVLDEGSGMSAEEQSRACEPRYSTKPGHLGMGLATVAAVMRDHRGSLRIHSQQGRGTSVKLIFPSTVTKPEPVASKSPPVEVEPLVSEHAVSVQRRVLLVDDEAGVREVTARMIEALGFEVEEADGGAAGLSLYLRHPERFAIVVADMTMPGMDGLQLFDELRARREDLPFVLMSGFSEAGALAHRNDGHLNRTSAAFLQKPFTFHRLQEVLEAVQANLSWA